MPRAQHNTDFIMEFRRVDAAIRPVLSNVLEKPSLRPHLKEEALQAEQLRLVHRLEVAEVLLVDQVQPCQLLLWQIQECLGLHRFTGSGCAPCTRQA